MSQPPKLLIVIFVSSSQPRPSPWPDMINLFKALYTKPLEICWQMDSTEFGSLYVVKSVRAVWWLKILFAESAGLVSKKCVICGTQQQFSLYQLRRDDTYCWSPTNNWACEWLSSFVTWIPWWLPTRSHLVLYNPQSGKKTQTFRQSCHAVRIRNLAYECGSNSTSEFHWDMRLPRHKRRKIGWLVAV